MTLAEVERRFILHTLKLAGGNRTQAAKRLDIALRTLRGKLAQYRAAGQDPDSDAPRLCLDPTHNHAGGSDMTDSHVAHVARCMDVADAQHETELRSDDFAARAAMAAHCKRCSKAVELLSSETLAIAQLAVWTLAEHHMNDRQRARFARSLLGRLELA